MPIVVPLSQTEPLLDLQGFVINTLEIVSQSIAVLLRVSEAFFGTGLGRFLQDLG